jgi:hypothetical protein
MLPDMPTNDALFVNVRTGGAMELVQQQQQSSTLETAQQAHLSAAQLYSS